MNWKEVLLRLKNTGTVISLASLIILVLITNGVAIDSERVMTTVKAVCAVGVLVGAMNNPVTPGLKK